MKQIVVILFIISCIFLQACRPTADNQDSSGQPIFYNDFNDKWLIFNYWANWCKPCSEEIPVLNQFNQTYHQKVQVFGVHFDTLSLQELQNLKLKFAITYPLLVNDPNSQFALGPILHLPATIVISPDRKKIKTLWGIQSKESLLASIS